MVFSLDESADPRLPMKTSGAFPWTRSFNSPETCSSHAHDRSTHVCGKRGGVRRRRNAPARTQSGERAPKSAGCTTAARFLDVGMPDVGLVDHSRLRGVAWIR